MPCSLRAPKSQLQLSPAECGLTLSKGLNITIWRWSCWTVRCGAGLWWCGHICAMCWSGQSPRHAIPGCLMEQCGSLVFSVPFGNSLIYEAAQPIHKRHGMGIPTGMMYSRAVDPVAAYLATLRLCCTSPWNNLLESLPMFYPFSLLADISKSCPTIFLQDKGLICIG